VLPSKYSTFATGLPPPWSGSAQRHLQIVTGSHLVSAQDQHGRSHLLMRTTAIRPRWLSSLSSSLA